MQLLIHTIFASFAVVYGSTPLGFGQCRYSSIRGEEVKDVDYLEFFAHNWLYIGKDVTVPYIKESYLVSSTTSEEKLHEFRFGHNNNVVMIRFYVEFDSNKKLWSRAELCEFSKYEAPEEVVEPAEPVVVEAPAIEKKEPTQVEKEIKPAVEKVAVPVKTQEPATKEASFAQKEEKKVDPAPRKGQEKPGATKTEAPKKENVKVDKKNEKQLSGKETPDVKSQKTADYAKEKKPAEKKQKVNVTKKAEKTAEPSKFTLKRCLMIAFNIVLLIFLRRVLTTLAKVAKKIYALFV